jgi:hypothetical protein
MGQNFAGAAFLYSIIHPHEFLQKIYQFYKTFIKTAKLSINKNEMFCENVVA